MSSVAVVILNYNGSAYLSQFLPGLISYSAEARLIVADNSSTDNSLEILAREFPQVEVIVMAQNLGYAGGYNAALQHIKADVYVLLNNDVALSPNWLAPLVQSLSNEKIAACQPKIKSFKNQDYWEYAGAAGGYIDYLGYPFCAGRLFDTIEKDEGQYNQQRNIFWASGACLVVKAEVFHKAGGFDAGFFAHMEEIDLCWRIQRLGYHIAYVPESTVYHVGGGTLQKENPFKTYLNFRNSLLMLLKNVPATQLIKVLFVRMLLDGLAGIKFLIEGQYQSLWAILRAHGYFYRNFSKYLEIRRQLSESNDFKNKAKNIYPESLVLAYFLKKKRKFTDLPPFD